MTADVIAQREVPAQRLQVDDQVLTRDGWQTIRGLIVFRDQNQVTVFTDEYRDDYWDGWEYRFGELVQTRTKTTDEHDRLGGQA